ncbi:MAG: hypothetical protein H7Z43_10795, partial [Clostridia bacterium]|nr:hypothetical protein [Deltaproteobacteria bacterium]
ADWLMRFYGFDVDEITTAEEPNLSLDIDPKLAWALRHRALFPVDVNVASREMMLRVPGLGMRNVDRIIASRRFRAITTADLKRLRVPLSKTLPFIVTFDRNADVFRLDSLELRRHITNKPQQLGLFSSALSGEV